MGKPVPMQIGIPTQVGAYPGKQNILVPGGIENNVISLVAASEKETAQTGRITWNVMGKFLARELLVFSLKTNNYKLETVRHRVSRDATVMACLLKNEPTS